MPEVYIKFGCSLKNNQFDELSIDTAKQTFCALQSHHEFELVELRYLGEGENYSEIIVADCLNDRVLSQNDVGIKYQERLGLRFYNDTRKIPEVRALRSDFPITLHQHDVFPGEPLSLCIYFEPWSAVERTWTAQKYLRRILWWLENISCNTLHADDQPLEPFYFDTRYTLVLPADFDEKAGNEGWALNVEHRPLTENGFRILVGQFEQAEKSENKNHLSCELFSFDPVTHNAVERNPSTLGELHEQFAVRGVDFGGELFKRIKTKATGSGISKPHMDLSLVVLHIPLTRKDGSEVEKNEIKGFLLHSNLVEIGIKDEVLIKNQDKYWWAHIIGDNFPEISKWRDVRIELIEIIVPFTREIARKASGVTSDGPIGVLAGAGALGSSIVNLWYRQGWGTWTLIDNDIIKPHNLARHLALEPHIGSFKVHTIKSHETCIYPHEIQTTSPIADRVDNFSNNYVCNALDSAELVVDVTTTLEVPRDLSTRLSIKRLASVFITPLWRGRCLVT